MLTCRFSLTSVIRFAIGWSALTVLACGGQQSETTATTAGGTTALATGGGTTTHSALSTGGMSVNATGGAVSTSHTTLTAALGGGSSLSTMASGGMTTLPNTGGASAVANAGSSAVGAQAVATFTTTYVTPYCARLAQCCTQAGFAAPSAASCANNELGFYESSLAGGKTTVSSAAIAELLSSIRTSCDQPSYALFGNLTAGTLPSGSECTEVAECAGENVACIVPSSLKVGKCVSLSRGKVGDACAVGCDNTSICKWSVYGGQYTQNAACWDEDGLRCDSATDQCVALAGVDKTCESSSDCGQHATCVNSVCMAKGKLGESCAITYSCESTLICNANYVCEKMSIAWSGNCE